MPCRILVRPHRGAHRRLGVGALVALVAAAALALPAFSAAQSPAASNPAAAARADDAPAATDDAPGPAQPPAPAQPPPPAADAVPIVLVLPLESAAYGRAASAVRAGFVAAAEAAKARIRVLSHPDGNPLAAFAEARALGARVVVGPLVRDDLRALSAAEGELPTTLALNQFDDGIALPEHVYALTLTIEAEGRQLARLVRSRGAQTVAVISADTALQRRFSSAFLGEWILQGGGPPETHRFDRAPEALTRLRKVLSRAPVDALLLAVDGTDVALLKPFVGATPSYTSSQVNDRLLRESQRDLDDLQFVDLPWLTDPTHPSWSGLPRGNYVNPTLERLYALGIDAFRIARVFADRVPATLELDGATGHLTLEGSRLFAREGQLMRVHNGQVGPAVPR